MYGLDINFLNDREDRQVAAAPTRPITPAGSRRPIMLGLIFMVAALGLVGGYWLVLRTQVRELRARSAELDQEIAQVQSQLQAISTLRAQIEAVEAENQAFVTVFNRILPWSALLQDLRNSTPARVQIESLNQTAGNTLTDQSGAEPPEAGGVEITGKACTFNDVNDFLLLLQRSPLLDSNSVQLTQSERPETPLPPEEGACPGVGQAGPVFLVDYTIRANLTTTPVTDLVEELENRGTVGLVSRIRALRDTGVLNGADAEAAEAAIEEATQDATEE